MEVVGEVEDEEEGGERSGRVASVVSEGAHDGERDRRRAKWRRWSVLSANASELLGRLAVIPSPSLCICVCVGGCCKGKLAGPECEDVGDVEGVGGLHVDWTGLDWTGVAGPRVRVAGRRTDHAKTQARPEVRRRCLVVAAASSLPSNIIVERLRPSLTLPRWTQTNHMACMVRAQVITCTLRAAIPPNTAVIIPRQWRQILDMDLTTEAAEEGEVEAEVEVDMAEDPEEVVVAEAEAEAVMVVWAACQQNKTGRGQRTRELAGCGKSFSRWAKPTRETTTSILRAICSH